MQEEGEATKGNECAHCGVLLSKALKCSLCKVRVFCSKDCQVQVSFTCAKDFFLQIYRALWQNSRAPLQNYRALLRNCWVLWQIYRT